MPFVVGLGYRERERERERERARKRETEERERESGREESKGVVLEGDCTGTADV